MSHNSSTGQTFYEKQRFIAHNVSPSPSAVAESLLIRLPSLDMKESSNLVSGRCRKSSSDISSCCLVWKGGIQTYWISSDACGLLPSPNKSWGLSYEHGTSRNVVLHLQFTLLIMNKWILDSRTFLTAGRGIDSLNRALTTSVHNMSYSAMHLNLDSSIPKASATT